MLWANRNGFYYVLDRATGEFLHAAAFVKQNWAEGIDRNGRPILTANAEPTPRGTLTWPGLSGGGNWWSPSYNPATKLVYVPFADAPKVFFKNSEIHERDLSNGQQFLGSVSAHTGDPLGAGVRALDALTGGTVWEYTRQRPRRDRGYIGGTLTTAGGLVFVGDLTHFLALDAEHGHELWRVNLGGLINASPIAFAAGGGQRIAIPAGNTLYVFGL
jgi:glucose dehydrogenase